MKENILAISEMRTREDKLQYLNNLVFQATVTKKDEKFYLQIPQFSIIVSRNDLSEAYIELAKAKNSYFNHMIDLQSEEDVVLLCKSKQSHFNMTKLRASLISYFVIFALVIATLGIGSCTARNVLVGGVAKIPEIMKRESKRFSHKMKNIPEAPEEKKRERVARFKVFMKEVAPYIQVMNDVFKENSK